MPTRWSTDPLVWGNDVIKHMVLTGHRQILCADDPVDRSYGIACTDPVCGQRFAIRQTFCKEAQSAPARLISDYWGTLAGKQRVLKQLIASANEEDPIEPPKRATAWDRILKDD